MRVRGQALADKQRSKQRGTRTPTLTVIGGQDRRLHSRSMTTEILPAPSPVAEAAPDPSSAWPLGAHIEDDGCIRSYVKLQWGTRRCASSTTRADKPPRRLAVERADCRPAGARLDPERCAVRQQCRPDQGLAGSTIRRIGWLERRQPGSGSSFDDINPGLTYRVCRPFSSSTRPRSCRSAGVVRSPSSCRGSSDASSPGRTNAQTRLC